MKRIFFFLITALPFFVLCSNQRSFAYVPTPSHVVILVLENHGYGTVVGSAAAPYINSLIADPYCALFTQSYALSHPSQPNYLQLYSGSAQGVTTDNVPANLPFATSNLGAELLTASRTFTGYSEDLPSVGYIGATSGAYARKHNPWVNWQGTALNGIPATDNQPFTSFPANYDLLPAVSYVVPNQGNDMHNGTDPARITTCDTWIKNHLNGYIQWAKTHNSLLILTFDEDDNASNQHILTLFIGQMVMKGSYSTHIDHYNVLRVLEEMYSLTHAGSAATASIINYCWLTTINLKFFINGYYLSSGMMDKVLYNELVDLNPASTNVDTVFIELHDPVVTATVAASYKGVLQTNGTLACSFPGTIVGHSYYIAVKHRNLVQSWSGAAVSISATTSYDFTMAKAKTYASNCIAPETGIWAFYNGDLYPDGNIDLLDYPDLDYGIRQGVYGYYANDLNGDGNTDILDFPILDWCIHNGIYAHYP